MGKGAVVKQSKESIAKAANSKKGKKKKWGQKAKKDAINNEVFLTKGLFTKIEKQIPRMKTITVATLSQSFSIIGSIARRLIKHYAAAGKIKPFGTCHRTMYLYTGVDYGKKKETADKDGKKGKGKGKKNKKAKKNKE